MNIRPTVECKKQHQPEFNCNRLNRRVVLAGGDFVTKKVYLSVDQLTCLGKVIASRT